MKEKILSRRNVNKFLLSTGNKMASILRYMSSKETWTVDKEDHIKKKCNNINFNIGDISTDDMLLLSYCMSTPRAVTLINEKSSSYQDDGFMPEFERKMLYLGDDDIMSDAVKVARARMIFLGRMNLLSRVFDSSRRRSIMRAIKQRNKDEDED